MRSIRVSFAEPSGYVLLTKDDLNAMKTSQKSIISQLEEATAEIRRLQEQRENSATSPVVVASHSLEESVKTLIDLNSERRSLTIRLEEAKEELSYYKQEIAKLNKTIKSCEEDYDALLADNNYLEDFQKRTRNLCVSGRRHLKAASMAQRLDTASEPLESPTLIVSAKSASIRVSVRTIAHGHTLRKRSLTSRNTGGAKVAEDPKIYLM